MQVLHLGGANLFVNLNLERKYLLFLVPWIVFPGFPLFYQMFVTSCLIYRWSLFFPDLGDNPF